MYLNSPLSLTLGDCIKGGVAIPHGRLTFSNGALWYNYSALSFHTDSLGAPRTLTFTGVKTQDKDFINHSWLKETYSHILREMSSFDPFYARLERVVDRRVTVTFGTTLSCTCNVEVSNGWRLHMNVGMISVKPDSTSLKLLTLSQLAE